jgi:hypothetical protein
MSLNNSTNTTSTKEKPKPDLLEWANVITEEYPNVNISNFSNSWQSGLGFCALVHHYKPAFIDYYALDPADWIGNLQKAFWALKTLGVGPGLSAEEVAQNPDENAIRSYLYGVHEVLTRKNAPLSGSHGREAKRGSHIISRADEVLTGLFSPGTVITNVKPNVTYKVIILGDSGVGKSTLFERWKNNFFQHTSTTVGMELWTKIYRCEDLVKSYIKLLRELIIEMLRVP